MNLAASVSYYDRQKTENTDGTPLFCGDYDKASEQDVRAILQQRWNCEIIPFGRLCPVDFYAARDGRMVGVLELKTRTHEMSTYPDVFLNVRKWFCLCLAETGLGCPALFVVRFTDKIGYIRVSDIESPKVTIGGCKTTVKSRTDIEPVIRVLISDLKVL